MCRGAPPCRFGSSLVAGTDRGICALSSLSDDLGEEAIGFLRNSWPRAALRKNQRETKLVAERIFNPSQWRNSSPLTVLVRGTNFQIKVWEALVRIPPGCAVSYEQVAFRIGAPASARPVGSAVARNPVAFLIPCHRVIRKTGDFGDYHFGAAKKKAILAWESAHFRGPSGHQ